MSETMTKDEIDKIDSDVEQQDRPKKKKGKAKAAKGWASGRVIIMRSGIYFFATCQLKEVIDPDGEAEERRVVVLYIAEPDRDFNSPQEYPKRNWKRVKKRQFEAVRQEYKDMPLDENIGLSNLSL